MKVPGSAICVIGCGGFVGSHVTAELLRRGREVVGTLQQKSLTKSAWLESMAKREGHGAAHLTLVQANVFEKRSLLEAMNKCSGVIVCAGSPVIERETIELMEAVAENTSDAAIERGIDVAVFTSSTGSTNPPDGEPSLKNEIDHWSDPDIQLQQKKYAAVGKTLLDLIVLKKMEHSGGKFRVCVINPSMIVGPAFQIDPVVSHVRFADILNGTRMADRVPNTSLSLSDVRDLAALHVNALERKEARGRYFGVKQSWHWREILKELEQLHPGYSMPLIDRSENIVQSTKFDLTRQHSLGVEMRGLGEMLADHINELHRRRMI
jgi:nucleoside-diphosphate-sugar epimerase